MKRYTCLIFKIFVLLFISTNALSFSDVGTHPKITEIAAGQSVLKTSNYLKDNLGFLNGLEQIITSKSIQDALIDGSHTEDSGTESGVILCKRGLNHFYDPATGAGLDET